MSKQLNEISQNLTSNVKNGSTKKLGSKHQSLVVLNNDINYMVKDESDRKLKIKNTNIMNKNKSSKYGFEKENFESECCHVNLQNCTNTRQNTKRSTSKRAKRLGDGTKFTSSANNLDQPSNKKP